MAKWWNNPEIKDLLFDPAMGPTPTTTRTTTKKPPALLLIAIIAFIIITIITWKSNTISGNFAFGFAFFLIIYFYYKTYIEP